jgi:polyhydroxyalkanoate synthase subunit PhaC
MMHVHMPTIDPLAEAFLAGQKAYKKGLLTLVNQRRETKRKKSIAWPKVGQSAQREIWRRGSARLIRYDALASKSQGLPLLLVCSLINRPYVLDLLPDRSVVRRLLEAGRDVWLLDWGTPVEADNANPLSYYANELLGDAAAQVVEHSGAPKLHVLGYCMGGTFALMASKQLPLASLIAMATPVDFNDGGMLSLWSRAPGFDPAELIRVHGHAPPHLLQPAFKMLDPIGLATKMVHVDEKLDDDDFVQFFLAMETWLEDSVGFPGRAFIEWVQLYRDNALVEKQIDLSRVSLPVLSLVAEGDYITPPVSSHAIKKVMPRCQHDLMTLPGGHIGLATSSAAQKKLWPAVARWLAAHDPRKRTKK